MINITAINIFTFGVGGDGSGWIKDLNHSFLKSLAINNNGQYKRIKSGTADTAMTEYFNILSQPKLMNIKIKYDNKNIDELTQTQFNTLYEGNDLIIGGKIQNLKHKLNELNMSISAIIGMKTKSDNKYIIKPVEICKKMKINLSINESSTNNTERIWAYLKLKQFAAQKLIINDMIEMDDDEKKEQESLPLSLAIKYKFVTPWTSMIVVKEKDDKDQDQDEEDEKEEPQNDENALDTNLDTNNPNDQMDNSVSTTIDNSHPLGVDQQFQVNAVYSTFIKMKKTTPDPQSIRAQQAQPNTVPSSMIILLNQPHHSNYSAI